MIDVASFSVVLILILILEYPVKIKKTSEEDDWEARVPREFGTKQQDKPTGDASAKQSSKPSPQR